MKKISNSLLVILLMLSSTAFSQKILLNEDFVKPLKWKTSSLANGAMTFEKEGAESVMKIEAYDGKEFQATLKVPANETSTKTITIQYDFYLNDLYNSQVFFGESPNRIKVIAEKNKTQRLCGESIQMAEGAKFVNASPNVWHKMLINCNMQNKLATFTIDGKELKVVDLNQQPEKSYPFAPTLIAVKSIKGGFIKIKSIIITEI